MLNTQRHRVIFPIDADDTLRGIFVVALRSQLLYTCICTSKQCMIVHIHLIEVALDWSRHTLAFVDPVIDRSSQYNPAPS